MSARLQAELLLRRAGWPAPVGALLLGLGLGANHWWLPLQQQRVAAMQVETVRLMKQAADPVRAAPPPTADALLAIRLTAFDNALAARGATPELIKSVFAEAGKVGLTLAQAEYHLVEDKKGGFATYQMVLPVQGPYVKLREFIDGVLASNPAVAMQEIAFKRSNVGSAATEAHLRLVFYMRAEAQ